MNEPRRRRAKVRTTRRLRLWRRSPGRGRQNMISVNEGRTRRASVRNLAVVAFALLGLAGPAIAQGPPPARVRVEPLKMMDVEQRRSVTGDLRASARSRVATRIAGQVLELLVDV